MASSLKVLGSKSEWWTPIVLSLCSCAAITDLTGTFCRVWGNNIATRPDQNPWFPKIVLLTFDFDTKELPGFCTAAIKACWGQDKATAGKKGKCQPKPSHSLSKQKANLCAPGRAREGLPSAFLMPAISYSFHPDHNLQNLPFSLQVTV